MSVTERRKIEIRAVLEEFVKDKNTYEYGFTDLSTFERALVHKHCRQLGLSSKSHWVGDGRCLMVYKKRTLNEIGASGTFTIPEVRLGNCNLSKEIEEFLLRCPVSEVERLVLVGGGVYHPFPVAPLSGQLLPNFPGIPRYPNYASVPVNVMEAKDHLPVQNCRCEFLHQLASSQVVLILGETGSGKSTQIPQFILENSTATFNPCRIVVAEPRRIAAISLAERVAVERGERLGGTVGYQIRLESRHSPRTLLTYCTNGILLKAVVSDPSLFHSVTHLIIDEIHERDKYSDFLLIILRDILPQYPALKLIIMSASLELALLDRYFRSYALLNIPGRSYAVVKYYLEDVLFMSNYTFNLLKRRRHHRPGELAVANQANNVGADVSGSDRSSVYGARSNAFLDGLLESMWRNGCSSEIMESWPLVLNHVCSVSINYQHSVTGANLLMVTAGLGQLDVVNYLLDHGADPLLTSSNGWQALHWAAAFGNDECVHRLSSVTTYQPVVDVYQSLVDDDQVDVGLILELLVFICSRMSEGAILVFLPGYEEILQVKEAINRDNRLSKYSLAICMLHSQIHGHEQRRAFNAVPNGTRKIVLSTNVAEVSITLEDVSYVIDTGKMKQTVYDTVNDVSALSMTWISKTNVIQRAGRAGRCRDGICFCLYTDIRFNSMADKAIPEILRAPIHELCLQAKLLKPDLSSVAEFLSKAPEPPSEALVYSNVRLLKTIGAFDAEERITVLGRCLVELPIDPQLGKMILYGAMLRCLDPVLTIAAFLSYRDPFILPRERAQADLATLRRYELAQRMPFSDHGVFLNAFLEWESARRKGQQKQFLWKHFLTASAMEKVVGIKGLLLRALQSLGFGSAFASDVEFYQYYNANACWPVVKAALTVGAYPNIALADNSCGKLMTETESAALNSSSVLLYCRDGRRVVKEPLSRALSYLRTEWVIFNEMRRQNSLMQIHYATAVSSMAVALFAGPSSVSVANVSHGRMVNTENECWDSADDGIEVSEVAILHLDNWLKVRMEDDLAEIVVPVREKLHSLFIKQLMDPSRALLPEEEEVLAVSARLLTEAEKDITPGYRNVSLFQCGV